VRDLGMRKKGFAREEESKQLVDETIGGRFRS
jgi:hypothetical protein